METKRKYTKPNVQEINLDNEISILMTSTPPGDPFKSASIEAQDNAYVDPYA